MANNLFISYDLISPGQKYDTVIAEIKKLGAVWAKVHYSLFYVRTELTAEQAEARVWKVMDSNDKLIVIHALSAAWHNLGENSDYIRNNWNG